MGSRWDRISLCDSERRDGRRHVPDRPAFRPDRRTAMAPGALRLLAAAGWWLSATLHSPWLVLLALTMAQVGMISMIGPFWSLLTSFMSGIGAVGGIALINTIANTGGAFSSPLMSRLEKATGSFAAGQLVLAVTMLAGAGIALVIRHDPAGDRISVGPRNHSMAPIGRHEPPWDPASTPVSLGCSRCSRPRRGADRSCLSRARGRRGRRSRPP